MSMCHGKSVQPSHPGWAEHENKGPEQKGQKWGKRRVVSSHKEGKDAQCQAGCACRGMDVAEGQRCARTRGRGVPGDRPGQQGGSMSAQERAAPK